VNLLKTLRFQRQLSQDEIARLVGADQSRISRLERDLLRDTPATLALRRRVAGALGVPIDAIFPRLKILPEEEGPNGARE